MSKWWNIDFFPKKNQSISLSLQSRKITRHASFKLRFCSNKDDNFVGKIVDFEGDPFAKMTEKQYKSVTHVIFDMDGTLLDTEPMYDKIIQEIATPCKKIYTKDMRIKILGTPEKETARLAIELMDLPLTSDEFLEIYRKKIGEYLDKSPNFMKGAEKLVKHLHANNIPIAVATSSSLNAYKLKTLKHHNVFKLFDHIVCGSSDSEVKFGKPAPDIFLICAQRFKDKPKPENCLVLEDAPNGVKGAFDAGMQTVLIPDPMLPDEKRQLATLVIDSLESFHPELFGLPAMD